MSTRKLTQLIQTTTGIGFTGSRGEIGYTGSAASGVTGYSGSAGGAGISGNLYIDGTLTVNNTILPTTSNIIDIGSPEKRFGTLYLAGNTIYLGGATIASTPSGDISFVTSSGTVDLNSNAVSFLSNVSSQGSGFVRPRFISLVQSGNITVPFTGVARFYPTANIIINNVYASIGTLPTTGGFNFTLLKNGSIVGTYNIDEGSYRLGATEVSISVTNNDYLTLNVTSGAGATDLRVDLEYI